jgi:pimeloyl-ACP methyl ester carboxylesterase
VGFLTDCALTLFAALGTSRYHLVGHSMGGLTALLLARQRPDAVLSFTNIEGNLAPEDCFLSRQIITYPENDHSVFLARFIERLRFAPHFGNASYATRLQANVCLALIEPLFRSMVEISDTGRLLDEFLALSCPRQFLYGSQNASLSYLDRLRDGGVRLVEIPWSGHFPMYSNPPAMWTGISEFIRGVDEH